MTNHEKLIEETKGSTLWSDIQKEIHIAVNVKKTRKITLFRVCEDRSFNIEVLSRSSYTKSGLRDRLENFFAFNVAYRRAQLWLDKEILVHSDIISDKEGLSIYKKVMKHNGQIRNVFFEVPKPKELNHQKKIISTKKQFLIKKYSRYDFHTHQTIIENELNSGELADYRLVNSLESGTCFFLFFESK